MISTNTGNRKWKNEKEQKQRIIEILLGSPLSLGSKEECFRQEKLE